VTRLQIGLRSRSGDAPGNLREVMVHLPNVGRLCALSDIHYRKPAKGACASEYGVAAELETEQAAAVVRTDLHAVVEGVAARVVRSAQFGVDVDVVDLRVGHGKQRESATGVSPLVLVALDSILTQPKPQDADVRTRIRALPHDMRKAIVRVPGTAELSPVQAVDYDLIGDARMNYHDVRPLSRFDRELFSCVRTSIGLRRGLRVLDVGCGTGRFSTLLAAAHAAVTGVDKSANMLTVAREDPRAAQARIDYLCMDANIDLPQGPFDAIAFFFSVQYMKLGPEFWARLRGRLVPGGVVAFASFPHAHFVQTEHARFFSSIAAIDMARFPSVPRVCALLHESGFSQVAVDDVVWHEETPASTLIARTAARYLSTFHLLSTKEFERGLAAMRDAYAKEGTVTRTIRAAVISARRRASAER